MTDTLYICSIDPGKNNFAFCIEEVDLKACKEAQTVEEIVKHGKVCVLENINLSRNLTKGKYIDTRIFINITDLLDKYREYWDKTQIILIEQQMSFGVRKINTMALKIAQHCFSYFSILYRDTKQIIEYPSYHKTQVLDAPKRMDKPARKKWAVERAIEYLKLRGDTTFCDNIEKRKKKDDVSDCLLMNISFVYQICVLKKDF
jgi:hypothetical protein